MVGSLRVVTLAQVAAIAQTPHHAASDGPTSEVRPMAKRIVADRCCGAIIDVQEFFLMQLDAQRRGAIERNTANLVRLLGYYRTPMIATLERPLETKGQLPA